MTLDSYAQAAQPAIRYAANAQGTSPPGFALIAAPMTPEHPQHVLILARRPGESGPAFQARVVGLESLGVALARGHELRELDVLFIDSLPPAQWRMRQLERCHLHWLATYGATESRLAACAALLEESQS